MFWERFPYVCAVFVTAALITVPAYGSEDAIENLASIVASESVCGYTVNRQMLEIATVTLIGDPESVAPGGTLWPQMQRNMSRIKNLTNTPDGRRSFCQRVRADLSAFFD